MGGGEGSAAREALRHKTVQRVVMCDIDEVRCVPHHLNTDRSITSTTKLVAVAHTSN